MKEFIKVFLVNHADGGVVLGLNRGSALRAC